MSPAPVAPYLPTNELVAVAWLSQRVPGLSAGQVATTLPGKRQDGTLPWGDEGFVQVQAIPGGMPDIELPVRHPVLQVDCWAATVDAAGNVSMKPPWNKANRLAELIRNATEHGQIHGRPVVLPEGYLGARVQAVYLITEPTRVPGDPSGYARFTLDLALDWVRQ